jgi:hypothetical protein
MGSSDRSLTSARENPNAVHSRDYAVIAAQQRLRPAGRVDKFGALLQNDELWLSFPQQLLHLTDGTVNRLKVPQPQVRRRWSAVGAVVEIR